MLKHSFVFHVNMNNVFEEFELVFQRLFTNNFLKKNLHDYKYNFVFVWAFISSGIIVGHMGNPGFVSTSNLI